MKEIEVRRFVCRNLVEGIDPGPLRYVDLNGEWPVVEPFRCETADTVFIDGRVVLMRRNHGAVGADTPCKDIVVFLLDHS